MGVSICVSTSSSTFWGGGCSSHVSRAGIASGQIEISVTPHSLSLALFQFVFVRVHVLHLEVVSHILVAVGGLLNLLEAFVGGNVLGIEIQG